MLPARLSADGRASKRLQADLVGAPTGAMVYDAVPMTLAATPNMPGKYMLHVAGSALFWTPPTDTDPRMCKLILTVTTLDTKDQPVKSEAKALTVKAPNTVPPTGSLNRPITLEYQAPPDPKAVRARFVVRGDRTGRMGTADADLLHPASSQSLPQAVLRLFPLSAHQRHSSGAA